MAFRLYNIADGCRCGKVVGTEGEAENDIICERQKVKAHWKKRLANRKSREGNGFTLLLNENMLISSITKAEEWAE